MSINDDTKNRVKSIGIILPQGWNDTPSEEEVINNSYLNTLYTTDFSKGKYFQVVTQDEDGFEIKFAPRTMFKVL